LPKQSSTHLPAESSSSFAASKSDSLPVIVATQFSILQRFPATFKITSAAALSLQGAFLLESNQNNVKEFFIIFTSSMRKNDSLPVIVATQFSILQRFPATFKITFAAAPSL
jgi:hypothetical protein